MVKNPAVNLGFLRDLGSIPGLGIFPGGGYGNSFQYSCLENPMDRGAWWAAVHRELHMTEVTWQAQRNLNNSYKYNTFCLLYIKYIYVHACAQLY